MATENPHAEATDKDAPGLEMESAATEAPKSKKSSTAKIVAFAVAVVVIGAIAVGVAFAAGAFRGSTAPLSVPALVPPVKKATPKGLSDGKDLARRMTGRAPRTSSIRRPAAETQWEGQQGRRHLQVCTGRSTDGPDCKQPLEEIKSRLFSGGPTDFLDRLGKVDERMKSLMRRSSETSRGRKCMAEDAKKWSAPEFPGGAGKFDMWLQCQEDLKEGSYIFFGRKEKYWYLAEVQESTGDEFNGAVLAKISDTSSEVHIWQITSMSATVSGWLEITADNAGETSILQLSFATNEVGTTGIGCGVQMISSEGKILLKGELADRSCGNGLNWQGSYCGDAVTLANMTAPGSCDGLVLSTRVLNSGVAAAFAATAATFPASTAGMKDLGLTGFNVDA